MVEEMYFKVFHITGFRESYFAIPNIGPIQSDIKLIQPFPLSDDALHMQFSHNWPTDIRDILL